VRAGFPRAEHIVEPEVRDVRGSSLRRRNETLADEERDGGWRTRCSDAGSIRQSSEADELRRPADR
jgi:hypothetical protein